MCCACLMSLLLFWQGPLPPFQMSWLIIKQRHSIIICCVSLFVSLLFVCDMLMPKSRRARDTSGAMSSDLTTPPPAKRSRHESPRDGMVMDSMPVVAGDSPNADVIAFIQEQMHIIQSVIPNIFELDPPSVSERSSTADGIQGSQARFDLEHLQKATQGNKGSYVCGQNIFRHNLWWSSSPSVPSLANTHMVQHTAITRGSHPHDEHPVACETSLQLADALPVSVDCGGPT